MLERAGPLGLTRGCWAVGLLPLCGSGAWTLVARSTGPSVTAPRIRARPAVPQFGEIDGADFLAELRGRRCRGRSSGGSTDRCSRSGDHWLDLGRRCHLRRRDGWRSRSGNRGSLGDGSRSSGFIPNLSDRLRHVRCIGFLSRSLRLRLNWRGSGGRILHRAGRGGRRHDHWFWSGFNMRDRLVGHAVLGGVGGFVCGSG